MYKVLKITKKKKMSVRFNSPSPTCGKRSMSSSGLLQAKAI